MIDRDEVIVLAYSLGSLTLKKVKDSDEDASSLLATMRILRYVLFPEADPLLAIELKCAKKDYFGSIIGMERTLEEMFKFLLE